MVPYGRCLGASTRLRAAPCGRAGLALLGILIGSVPASTAAKDCKLKIVHDGAGRSLTLALSELGVDLDRSRPMIYWRVAPDDRGQVKSFQEPAVGDPVSFYFGGTLYVAGTPLLEVMDLDSSAVPLYPERWRRLRPTLAECDQIDRAELPPLDALE